MHEYRDPLRFSHELAVADGYDHYGATFAKWSENHPMVGRDGVVRMKADDPKVTKADFLLVPQPMRSGMIWWHVHRRLNENDRGKVWRHVGRFPFLDEASSYIDDIISGRERVYFQGIKFTQHALGRNAATLRK